MPLRCWPMMNVDTDLFFAHTQKINLWRLSPCGKWWRLIKLAPFVLFCFFKLSFNIRVKAQRISFTGPHVAYCSGTGDIGQKISIVPQLYVTKKEVEGHKKKKKKNDCRFFFYFSLSSVKLRFCKWSKKTSIKRWYFTKNRRKCCPSFCNL